MIALIDSYRKELFDIAEYAQDTVDNYVSCVVMFFEFAKSLGINPVFAKGAHIIKWVSKLQGLSPSRLEHHRSALRLFFALLVKRKILSKSPVDRLPKIRRGKPSTMNQPVPARIVTRLLSSIDRSDWYGKRNHLMISMLWALGLRVNELTSLRVKSFEPDIDEANRVGLLRVKGKNRKWRALFVVDRLYDELTDFLKNASKKNDPIFTTRAGKAISSDLVRKCIKGHCANAGIKQRITPHVLRHCFATEMYHCGTPLPALCVMMGHDKKAETTVYVHVSDKLKKHALDRINIEGRTSWYGQPDFLNI
jgi:site-specific recombinase XerD